MTENELNRTCESILKIFGADDGAQFPMDLLDLVENAQKLIEVYADPEGKPGVSEDLETEEGRQKAFLRICWNLSKISRLYSKKLSKIYRTHPDFDLKLEKMAKCQAALQEKKDDT